MKKLIVLAVLMALVVGCSSTKHGNQMGSDAAPGGERAQPIADPIRPVNEVFFTFNDKLYFWVLKPAAQGYSFVLDNLYYGTVTYGTLGYASVEPEGARKGVRNFFRNLAMPIRAVNCLLQGNLGGTGVELQRFGVNTTVGVLGFGDPATHWGLSRQREDFGQTIGSYGAGPGIYIVWPVFGPSSIRGTVGIVGDYFLNPLSYYPPSSVVRTGIKVYERVNTTSLRIGDYEEIKDQFSPYVALRDAYHQHRAFLVRQQGEGKDGENGEAGPMP